MSEVRLPAETRTEFGKGGARRTRRAGKVPAVIYGGGSEVRHVSLPAHDLANAIRHGGSNVLLTLDLADGEQLVIPKSIQRHPIKGYFEHLDLLAVHRGQKVEVDLHITVVGDVIAGGMLRQSATAITVEAEATHIPEGVEVNIDDVQIGGHVTAGDVTLPAGSTLVTDAETLVLAIVEAPTAADIDAEVSEAADELGIVEDAPESETDAAESGGADADKTDA